MIAVGLSFVAGLLTALSPCVLPALPIVVGSAAADRRHGPLALAAGLIVAFTVVGVALASAGSVAGLTEEGLRRVAAIVLAGAGLTLLSERLQDAISRWTSPIASAAARISGRAGHGSSGQFVVGAMLGGVWSPCVGPTLGAAIGLAASGHSVTRSATMMLAFGIGSAVPLLAVAYGARRVLANRQVLLRASASGKALFGVTLVAMGILVFSGMDRALETAALNHLPQWWIDLLASL